MKNLLKKVVSNHNFLSLMGNVSAAGLGFAIFAILARMLPKQDFGNLMIFLTIATFCDLLRTGFLQTPLIRFSSGVSEEEKKVTIGTAWMLGLIITLIVSVVSLGIYFIFGSYITSVGFLFFLKWAWLLSFATLPFNFAGWILQTELQFNKVFLVRWMNLGTYVALLIANMYLNLGINFIIYSFVAAGLLSSLLSICFGWTRITDIKYASKERMRDILNFGKFSSSTMIGSTLLRSSDTLMIGAFLGPASVAIYSIPAKLFEVVEIPLRSFVATALPKLSRLHNTGDRQGFRNMFEKSSGIITIMLIPLTIACFLFADYMVVFMGGAQYADTGNILRIFAVFALIMPLDRYTGVTLDVLNKPARNFQKVLLMLTIKVAGNLLVIFLVGKVWAIAVSSIFTFLAGVIFGSIFLKRMMDFSIKRLLQTGVSESISFAKKGLSKINPSAVS